MAKRTRIPYDARPMLSDDGLGEKVTEWKAMSRRAESFTRDLPFYITTRTEGADEDGRGDKWSVDKSHGMSFIKYIYALIEERGGKDRLKEPIRVLDLGGGACVFAEQLRREFGDAVDVFTTGLSKKQARRSRELIRKGGQDEEESGIIGGMEKSSISKELHPQDLKWRSIEQMHDFPEFDLIVDTYGEGMYTQSDQEDYLSAIVVKLNPGGLASICPAADEIERLPHRLWEYRRLFRKVADIELKIIPSSSGGKEHGVWVIKKHDNV